ncbi:hypothetical protein DM02DRAFT_684673 [Periconia macrospinosa]|uniref:Protein kinase domain-containing protein n=1 Tax=Periconia macrospinosa TaxID=97972 RepID=A0A2V1CXE6_9PLEO|nr:hypothetical protein DM02DRAFT_684673 [Periconia macrospinosa]
MCAKGAMQQSQYQPIQREINALRRIREKTLADYVRIPSLIGLITSENGVLGFLMDYIVTIPRVPNIAWYKMGSITVSERKKWYHQVRDMLEWIHDISLVWGDIKAENVVIDEQGNAWVIDFGGSYTDVWVDQNLLESEKSTGCAIATRLPGSPSPLRWLATTYTTAGSARSSSRCWPRLA